MSGHPTYVLLCDGRDESRPGEPECWREWQRPEGEITRQLTAIRVIARQYGWHHLVVGRKSGTSLSHDFCPSCVEGGAMARVIDRTTAGAEVSWLGEATDG